MSKHGSDAASAATEAEPARAAPPGEAAENQDPKRAITTSGPETSADRSLLSRVGAFASFAAPALVIALALGAASIVSAPSAPGQEASAAPEPHAVRVAFARPETITPLISVNGEARPRAVIDLAPEIAGRVADVSPALVAGGAFSAGDILLRIDDAEFRLRVTQARAEVARAESLYLQEKAEADAARAEWRDLKNETAPALAGRAPQLAEARAALAAARARVGEAELLLARTRLAAPFDGRIVSADVAQGRFLAAGEAIASIFPTDVMEVALPLGADELSRLDLKPGDKWTNTDAAAPNVVFSAVAPSGVEWSGRIVRTDNVFDAQTRTLIAYAQVPDPFAGPYPLAPGQFVTAHIESRRTIAGVAFPREALRAGGKAFIATQDNIVDVRSVSVAFADDDRALVTNGVRPGERVIVSFVDDLSPGAPLTVLGAEVADASAP